MQDIATIKSLLASRGLRPKHRFGQNFLHDPHGMRAILGAAAIRSGETILEVGPGTGTLTECLLEAGARVVASFAPGCPRAWEADLDRLTHAWAAGIEILEESDDAVASALDRHDVRVRYGDRDRVPPPVRRAAAAGGHWIADAPVPIHAVYPHRRHLAPKVPAFVDFLIEDRKSTRLNSSHRT